MARLAVTRFIDLQFPAEHKSLCSPELEPCQAPEINNVTHWISPGRGQPWALFEEKPQAIHVSSGRLCSWLMAPLTSVAHFHPNLVWDMFPTRDEKGQGKFTVKLCNKQGIWNFVIVDDLLPCVGSGTHLFAKPVGQVFWAPIVEKAIAKLLGSYVEVLRGNDVVAFHMLTGYPVEDKTLQELIEGTPKDKDAADNIWELLCSWFTKSWPMCTTRCTPNGDNDLVFSIIRFGVLKKTRAICLRSPTGFSASDREPTRLTDISRNWTLEEKMEKFPGKVDGGVTWITFHDYLKYFRNIVVSFIVKNFVDRRFTGDYPWSPNGISGAEIILPQQTNLYLSLFQDRPRCYPVDAQVALFRVQDPPLNDPGKFVFEKVECYCPRMSTKCYAKSKSLLIEPGRYLAIPAAFRHWDWQQGARPQYAMAIHAKTNIKTKEVTLPSSTLAEAMIKLTIEEAQEVMFDSDGQVILYRWNNDCVGRVVVVENRHPSRCCEIHSECRDVGSVISTRRELTTCDYIPAQHRQVIAIFTYKASADESVIKNSISVDLDFRLCNSNNKKMGPVETPDTPLLGIMKELHTPRPIEN